MIVALVLAAVIAPVRIDGQAWPIVQTHFGPRPVAVLEEQPPLPISPSVMGAYAAGGSISSGGCSSGPVHDLIVSYDWNDVEALAIASRESGCNPYAKNPISSASGVFQLVAFWWDGSNAFGWVFDPFDAASNVYHSYLIWQYQGGSFYPAWGL